MKDASKQRGTGFPRRLLDGTQVADVSTELKRGNPSKSRTAIKKPEDSSPGWRGGPQAPVPARPVSTCLPGRLKGRGFSRAAAVGGCGSSLSARTLVTQNSSRARFILALGFFVVVIDKSTGLG